MSFIKKSFKFIVCVFIAKNVMAADYQLKNQQINDQKIKIRLCKTPGLYTYPIDNPQALNHCLRQTQFFLKGLTYSAEGELTIKHYELRQRVWAPCTVRDVLQPAGKSVVLSPSSETKVGDIQNLQNSWKLHLELTATKPACFQ